MSNTAGDKKSTPEYGGLESQTLFDKMKRGGIATVGALTTGGILAYGLFSMARSNPRASARNMGFRVWAQGLTLGSILGLVAWTDYKRSLEKNSQDDAKSKA